MESLRAEGFQVQKGCEVKVVMGEGDVIIIEYDGELTAERAATLRRVVQRCSTRNQSR